MQVTARQQWALMERALKARLVPHQQTISHGLHLATALRPPNCPAQSSSQFTAAVAKLAWVPSVSLQAFQRPEIRRVLFKNTDEIAAWRPTGN